MGWDDNYSKGNFKRTPPGHGAFGSGGMHVLFAGMMPKHFFAAMPNGRLDDWDFEKELDAHQAEIAGVICEPIFQAANAMNFYDAEYLRRMRRACDAYDIPLVFDEIASGFHRTGPRWAHERALRVAEELAAEGFLASAIRYPTVPKGKARLRIAVSAAHTPAQLRRLKTLLEIT